MGVLCDTPAKEVRPRACAVGRDVRRCLPRAVSSVRCAGKLSQITSNECAQITFFVNGVVAAKHTGCKISGAGLIPMIAAEGPNQFTLFAGATAFAFPVDGADSLLSLRQDAGKPLAPTCARLDGGAFYATPGSTSAHSSLSALTVEAAVRIVKLPSGPQSVVSRVNDSSGFSLGIGVDGALVFVCGGRTHTSGPRVLMEGIWQHVAATCNGRTVSLLVNGEVVFECDSPVKASCSEAKLCVGGPTAAARAFVGDVAFVRLWGEALVPATILRNMRREAVVARSASRGGLVSEWLFSEPGGKVALDTGSAIASLEGGPRCVRGSALRVGRAVLQRFLAQRSSAVLDEL